MLARSDSQRRERFLAFVCEHRAPRIAAHWAFLLKPLVPQHVELEGLIRYRQIEYYRMPVMAYLALDDPRALTRDDFVRLGLVTGATGATRLCPTAERTSPTSSSATATTASGPTPAPRRNTRYLCSGHALVVVGDAHSEFFGCRERGVLAQFRHQHFLLFLIAHFQKAALLMFSDRLVEALKRLDISDAASRCSRFKRAIRQLRDLPALHAPLLVPRDLRAGAGARRCSTCAPSTSGSTRCTPRSRSASPT